MKTTLSEKVKLAETTAVIDSRRTHAEFEEFGQEFEIPKRQLTSYEKGFDAGWAAALQFVKVQQHLGYLK